jgi:hypothetical protein
MSQIKISASSDCHLWNKSDLTREELHRELNLVHIYQDDSHLIRKLLNCKQCGQLYFYEFYEEIDWSEGNDPQYCTWIPVDDPESGAALNTLSVFEILAYPSIRSDWPRDKDQPNLYRSGR